MSLVPHAGSVKVIEGLMFSGMTSMRAQHLSFSSLAALFHFCNKCDKHRELRYSTYRKLSGPLFSVVHGYASRYPMLKIDILNLKGEYPIAF
jgi:hypothetical protein